MSWLRCRSRWRRRPAGHRSLPRGRRRPSCSGARRWWRAGLTSVGRGRARRHRNRVPPTGRRRIVSNRPCPLNQRCRRPRSSRRHRHRPRPCRVPMPHRRPPHHRPPATPSRPRRSPDRGGGAGSAPPCPPARAGCRPCNGRARHRHRLAPRRRGSTFPPRRRPHRPWRPRGPTRGREPGRPRPMPSLIPTGFIPTSRPTRAVTLPPASLPPRSPRWWACAACRQWGYPPPPCRGSSHPWAGTPGRSCKGRRPPW
jgi:hypothetical protein